MTTAAGHAARRAYKAAAQAVPDESKEGLLARAGEALSGKGALIGAVALGAAGLAAVGVAAARASKSEKVDGNK